MSTERPSGRPSSGPVGRTSRSPSGAASAERRLHAEGVTRREVASMLSRVGSLLVAAQLVLVVACLAPVGPRVDLPTWVALVGLVLLGLGGLVGIAALLAMGRRTRVHPVPAPDAQLHTTGIYAVVRHPMYLAVGLACLGAVLASGRVLGLVAVPLLGALLAAKAAFEDRILSRMFGWQFAVYASRVPAIVPQPWRAHPR